MRTARCGLVQGGYWPGVVGYRGWYVEGDPCCALGALALAAGIDDARTADVELDRRPVLLLAIDTVSAGLTGMYTGAPVAWWNDHLGRQPGEVIAALWMAAAHLAPDPPEPNPPEPGSDAGPGGPSAKTFHPGPGTNPNHQADSKETVNV